MSNFKLPTDRIILDNGTTMYRAATTNGWIITFQPFGSPGAGLLFVPDSNQIWLSQYDTAGIPIQPNTTTNNSNAGGQSTGNNANTGSSGSSTFAGGNSSVPVSTDGYTLYYIYQNGLQNAFRDYSYANISGVAGDVAVTGLEGAGTVAVESVQMGPYAGINFNNLNNVSIPLQNYFGIEFDAYGVGGSPTISAQVLNGTTTVASKSITIPANTWTTFKILWDATGFNLGSVFTTFTNVAFVNPTGSNLPYQIAVNNVGLIVNPNPPTSVPLPALDASPAPAPVAGTPWLSVSGNKVIDGYGAQWVGRGVVLFDNKLDGTGIAISASSGAAEVNRRVDYFVGLGCDFFRLCLQALDSTGKVTSAANLINDTNYLAAVKTIVNHIGTYPNVFVELSLDIDSTLNPPVGGEPTIASYAILSQLVYSFNNCSHVLIGLCNEPRGNSSNSARLAQKSIMDGCIAAIRAAEDRAAGGTATHRHIVSVQGIDNYAREVLWYASNPCVDAYGKVIYACHLYDHQGDTWWNEYQQAAATIPVWTEEVGPAVLSSDPTGYYMTLAECGQWLDICEQLKTPYTCWAGDVSAAPGCLAGSSNAPGITLQLNAWGLLLINRIRAAKGLSPVPNGT